MIRKIILCLACGLLVYGVAACAQPAEGQSLPPAIAALDPIQKTDRILILAPHPDDETIACGGVIQEAVRVGADIRVAFLTNGDHNQLAFIIYEKRLTLRTGEFIHMGEVRRREATAAMKLLGVNEKKLIFLGYPDFGTFTIFEKYWQSKKPFKSLLTRISKVPYQGNLSYGAPYVGESILRDVRRILLDYKPTKIFVSHPADTNVDHKAFYLFLQVALRDVGGEISPPEVYPYLVHCLDWPVPRHYHPELTFQPPAHFLDGQVQWVQHTLNPQQVERKHQALLCHKSQTQSSAFYLLSFVRQNELFGDYREVELGLPAPAVSFFGFSYLFIDSGLGGELSSPRQVNEVKGEVEYALVDDALIIRIAKKEKLDKLFNVLVYLFGYSDAQDFSRMPKLRIYCRRNRIKVFDGKKMISSLGVVSELNPEEFILKVPLEVLGSPKFVLTLVKTFGGIAPVDTTGVRKIVIRKAEVK